ncbi:hypothetical protein Dsin_002148 [Dipteronia sinensis]|uniref:Uncharacterized protein n=1 Tax=Dipteronia sinensis TaxID=43782 RepID=A0AAE0B5K8_9ROSI|nr:hypothetical protein Dsin_002148 [Dipteronia sinensis]
MNYNIGGPSNFPSSSSDDYEAQLTTDLETIDAEEEAIITQHVVEEFTDEYLRSPNVTDVTKLLCIGQYAGRSGSPTIILEVVADYDLWIWHAYFSLPGTNNDINVLEASHLFASLAQGITPPAHYVIQKK